MALVKYNNNSISAITAVAGLSSGAMTLIKSQTASSSATISFVDGTSDVVLDSTYPIYVFKFINIHPANDGVQFSFQANVAGGSGYNEPITSAGFKAYHTEADSTGFADSGGAKDQAQGTDFESLGHATGNDNDQSCNGELWLFGISSTTYVKHFMARMIEGEDNSTAQDIFKSGYFNTTSAIDEFQFKFTSGNMDSGTIKLYGIKDS